MVAALNKYLHDGWKTAVLSGGFKCDIDCYGHTVIVQSEANALLMSVYLKHERERLNGWLEIVLNKKASQHEVINILTGL